MSYLLAQSQKTNIWEGNSTTQITAMRSGDFPVNGKAGDQEAVKRQQTLEALAVKHRKQMIADAGKLVTLAQELNSRFVEPARSAPTMAELQKAKDIEKLAKHLKDSFKP
jgi:hypothetical protein